MDERELNDSLLLQNQKLRLEVEDLKTLRSVVKENLELRSRLDSVLVTSNNNSMVKENSETSTVYDPGKKSMFQGHDSVVDESSFRASLIAPHRTSSPLTQSTSLHPDTTSSSSSCQKVKGSERLLGEIGFQLERRILSHVFYKQTRLYGFTVQNIMEKIVQVSTHPLTGQVDEAYRSELNQRYVDLMDRLCALGYNMKLHPPFTEFIINMYGILKYRPDTPAAQKLGYNDVNVLGCVMVEKAPASLLKDLLVLFTCLCYLAKKDGKPLILW